MAVPHLPFLLVSRHWSHFVMPTDSPDAPGLGCIWGGICPVALFSSGKGPHLGPYLVTESADIPCFGFICEGLDSGGRHQQVPLGGGFLAAGGVPFTSAASCPGKEHQWLNSQFYWFIQFLI